MQKFIQSLLSREFLLQVAGFVAIVWAVAHHLINGTEFIAGILGVIFMKVSSKAVDIISEAKKTMAGINDKPNP